ncbi:hypothetical protein RRG08_006596 [Elysia crispata]|uniref:Uncharacterized protein n=1 Tax=Elysia crispata TaxID=231223 RepID=A0AAE0Z448_9GAST|nr:hypothetical protein RRG08_006596 [Elysia crispata]
MVCPLLKEMVCPLLKEMVCPLLKEMSSLVSAPPISMKTLLFSLLVVALVGFAFAEPELEKRILGVGLLKSAWKKVKETGKDIKDAYDSGALAKNVKDFGIRVLKAKVASDVIGSAIKHSKNLGK